MALKSKANPLNYFHEVTLKANLAAPRIYRLIQFRFSNQIVSCDVYTSQSEQTICSARKRFDQSNASSTSKTVAQDDKLWLAVCQFPSHRIFMKRDYLFVSTAR